MKNKTPYIITKRELAAYFSSPIAYIVTGIFLLVSGMFFFSVFFLQNRADLRSHFSLLPILLSLFIPAITMRLFAKKTPNKKTHRTLQEKFLLQCMQSDLKNKRQVLSSL